MQKNMFSAIKKWIGKNKVIDVIVFGSFMRSSSEPKDIDLCILINTKDEEKSIDLTYSLGILLEKEKLKSHIAIITADSFVKGDTLAKTLMNEGYSIKNEKEFSALFDMKNKSLFVYSLKKFSPSKRVQFHYLLKGRYGSKGILKEVHGNFLGQGIIEVPTSKEDLLKEIFNQWNVNYKINKILQS